MLRNMSQQKHLNAGQIYELLLQSGLKGAIGGGHFKLLGVDVTISSKDIVGGLFQEWLGAWLDSQNIYHRKKESSQVFPDFLLDKNNDEVGLLEIKAFDSARSPNFDVANFESYVRSLETQSFRLNADYLIISYSMSDSGVLRIHDIWLKKIWDITGPSGPYPIKIQQKQRMIYNIRPITWYSESSRYAAFMERGKFLMGILATLAEYKSEQIAEEWFSGVRGDVARREGVDVLFEILARG